MQIDLSLESGGKEEIWSTVMGIKIYVCAMEFWETKSKVRPKKKKQ